MVIEQKNVEISKTVSGFQYVVGIIGRNCNPAVGAATLPVSLTNTV